MKTEYYKAVRPDGTDFATGTTKPVVGEWMPRITGDLAMCQRGYHVSDSPSETLIGGSWPCRLFRVELKKTRKPYQKDGHKLVVPTYLPAEEMPAHMALGPNGAKVAALIERAKRLTRKEADDLYAARDAARYAAGYAAGYAARDAARYAARDAARDAAGYAAGYAALALVVEDLIPADVFDLLYGPWKKVIG